VLEEVPRRRGVVGTETFPNNGIPTLDLIRTTAILGNGQEAFLDVRRDVVDGFDQID
jgi:hypothetical protein